MPAESEDNRKRQRHQVLTPIFFMVTENAEPLGTDQHHIEGEIIDLSEKGLRMRSSHQLEEGEQISFDVTNEGRTILVGVGEVIHSLPEQVYGVRYLKVKKGG